MKRFILCLIFCELAVLSAMGQSIEIGIDHSNLTYQVSINSGTNSVEFDQSSFRVSSPNLCPNGAVAELKTKGGDYVGCFQPEKGYSSSWMSSTDPLPVRKYEAIEKSLTFRSARYKITDILAGLEQCLKPDDIDRISQLRLNFKVYLRVDGVESLNAADSDWFEMPDSIRQQLRHRSQEVWSRK